MDDVQDKGSRRASHLAPRPEPATGLLRQAPPMCSDRARAE